MGIQLKKNAQIGNETCKNTKDGFFMKRGNEQGNSSSRKSKESGGTIVIVDDATQDISTLYGST
jgi:hypothetical protein